MFLNHHKVLFARKKLRDKFQPLSVTARCYSKVAGNPLPCPEGNLETSSNCLGHLHRRLLDRMERLCTNDRKSSGVLVTNVPLIPLQFWN